MNVHGLVPSSVLGGAEMGLGREETMAITAITWHITPTLYDQYDSDMLTTVLYPIGSMYAIYGDIYHQYTPNVSIYTSTMDPMGMKL